MAKLLFYSSGQSSVGSGFSSLALIYAFTFSYAWSGLASTAEAVSFETLRVATGLSRPVFVTAPPGDRERVFIIEQHTGNIRILNLEAGTLTNPPFLTISGLPSTDEVGLLGLAFHPDYETNGFFYVFVADPDTRVLRYQVSSNPDLADSASRLNILTVLQSQNNHNAGWIDFGSDGMLYIALGDGGGAFDEGTGHTPGFGNAQDTTDNLKGKILRIDVDGDDFPADSGRNYAVPSDNPFVGITGDDEIWVYGLRNPFRSSFDRLTGDLYIGDVGQGRCEEINVQPAASLGGENYGWRLREGTIQTPLAGVGGPAPAGAIDPIMDYPHPGTGDLCSAPGAGFAGFSIIGGYVYRGGSTELQGRYIFADFVTSQVWSLLWDGSDPAGFNGTNYTELTNHSGDARFTPDIGSIGSISSFGEDDEGNLYVTDLFDGEVFRVPEPSWNSMNLIALISMGFLASRKRRVLGAGMR